MTDDIDEIVDWLRNAPSNEWCGPMLVKAADALERLKAERDAAVDEVNFQTVRAEAAEEEVARLNEALRERRSILGEP